MKSLMKNVLIIGLIISGAANLNGMDSESHSKMLQFQEFVNKKVGEAQRIASIQGSNYHEIRRVADETLKQAIKLDINPKTAASILVESLLNRAARDTGRNRSNIAADIEYILPREVYKVFGI